MKKLITAIITIITLGIAPIATATPAQARGGEGWWPQTTKPTKRGGEGWWPQIVVDPKPTCPQVEKAGRFFRVKECNPNV